MEPPRLRGRHLAAFLAALLAFTALCGLTEDMRPKSRSIASEIERALR
ncbi:hypothetical protein O9X98_05230 [Agrobacterium salinitolerans]|nr:hypothetical protein [Agrobacterium salinitolerans]